MVGPLEAGPTPADYSGSDRWGRLPRGGTGINVVAEAHCEGAFSPPRRVHGAGSFGRVYRIRLRPRTKEIHPMAVCPQCGFQTEIDPTARLVVCPQCRADGVQSYLRASDRSNRRRNDLLGLTALARAELAAARMVAGTGLVRERSTARGLRKRLEDR